MKKHSGGLGSFLNEVTQSADKSGEKNSAEIMYIDIEELETNPQNFYGLRKVEELAGLIAVSRLIEPLLVSKKSDGKYKIISGHRRRAAVQKLLEEGVYTERKLPCIIKAPEKIKIEQENGESIEFDEESVEMLSLIASNRGQREERTLEEKLQEIKYLEKFAKAIYNQKDRGTRGRFVSFFAEEILNISKSQLLRINSLSKLTPRVKQALDDGKISETAAMEIASMQAEEQDTCLEKILAGEIKGTVQAIQRYKSPRSKIEAEILNRDVEEAAVSSREPTVEIAEDKETESLIQKNFVQPLEKNIVNTIIDVPEEIGDPQKEAEEWFYQEKLAFYEKIYTEAKRLSEEEPNELKAAQWGIRASVARYNIEELKLQRKE